MSTLLFCAGAPNPYLDCIKEYDVDCFIGVDGGAKALVDFGVSLDYAIGDFDSVTKPASKQSVVLPQEKDDTDLAYALHYILSRYAIEKVHQIIILGALGGGRLDHLLCNIWLVHDERFHKWLPKLRFIEQTNTLTWYYPGQYTLKKDEKKRYLSFISVTPLEKLSLKNVKYPLCEKNYFHPVSLISNEFLSDTMNFSFENGILMVLQTNDK